MLHAATVNTEIVAAANSANLAAALDPHFNGDIAMSAIQSSLKDASSRFSNLPEDTVIRIPGMKGHALPHGEAYRGESQSASTPDAGNDKPKSPSR
jgi:hypothetical protein